MEWKKWRRIDGRYQWLYLPGIHQLRTVRQIYQISLFSHTVPRMTLDTGLVLRLMRCASAVAISSGSSSSSSHKIPRNSNFKTESNRARRRWHAPARPAWQAAWCLNILSIAGCWQRPATGRRKLRPLTAMNDRLTSRCRPLCCCGSCCPSDERTSLLRRKLAAYGETGELNSFAGCKSFRSAAHKSLCRPANQVTSTQFSGSLYSVGFRLQIFSN